MPKLFWGEVSSYDVGRTTCIFMEEMYLDSHPAVPYTKLRIWINIDLNIKPDPKSWKKIAMTYSLEVDILVYRTQNQKHKVDKY